jgi:hypothetical protein
VGVVLRSSRSELFPINWQSHPLALKKSTSIDAIKQKNSAKQSFV